MKGKLALLGLVIATVAALAVVLGSTAFAQIPAGNGYGPGGYGYDSGGYRYGTGGYGMMGHGMMGGGMMGGYYSRGYQQAPNSGNGYYGWGCGGWDW